MIDIEVSDLPPPGLHRDPVKWDDCIYKILLEQEQEHDPAAHPHRPKGPGGGQFVAKADRGTGSGETDITLADLPTPAADSDDTDDEDGEDADDGFEYLEPEPTLCRGDQARLVRFSLRSEEDFDKQDFLSVEVHDMRAEDSEYDFEVVTMLNNAEFDRDGYDSLREAVRRQKEITRDFKDLAKATESNYRDGLGDSLKAAQDSAATGSPEASVFKCLRRHIKTPDKIAAVVAALRDSGLC